MKTRIHTFLSIAVLPFALFSCMKEFRSELPAPEPLITISATIPGPTKVEAVDADAGLDWNWQAGDQVAVLSGENVSVFDIRSGFGPKEASFLGKEIQGQNFTILYPGNCTSIADLEGISLAEQMQTGIDSKAHLKYFAALEGLSDYKQFSFSSESGTLRQCGVLRFQLTLPEETVSVSRISLKAGEPVFHNGNAADALSDELAVSIGDGELGTDKTITAWMNTSWFDDVIPAETPLTLSVNAGEFNWVYDITSAADKTIRSGFVNKLTVADASVWATGGRYADGDGTEENPWQIKTAKQLSIMREDLVSKEMRYFKLVADIDMAGMDWKPLNNADPYDKYLNFDGGGHTLYNLTVGEDVAYPSFAGVLYGTIKDVTFTDAVINGGANKSGVVAGYMGTAQNYTANLISGVVVKNATVTASRHVGALVGQVATGDNTIADSHVLGGSVTGEEFTAGFAGYIQEATVTGCSSNAAVSGTKHVGGFVGKTETPVFTDCRYEGGTVSVSATGNNQSGGFVGYAAKVDDVGATFVDCYVKGASLKMSVGQRIGGFVGQADLGTTFFKCYVKDATIEAGQNSAGFVGVDYANTGEKVPGGGIYQCYVEGGSLTASGQNCSGFAGYPEKAVILNCFTTMDVEGGNYAAIGGFIGISKNSVTVQYCYSAGAVNGTNAATLGAFVGNADGNNTTHINSCIGWSSTLPFAGKIKSGCDVSNNYCGTEGTISYQAAALGWDPAIWDFSAKLK